MQWPNNSYVHTLSITLGSNRAKLLVKALDLRSYRSHYDIQHNTLLFEENTEQALSLNGTSRRGEVM